MNSIKPSFTPLAFGFAFLLCATANISEAQVCGGSWASNFTISYDCITGEYIGSVNPGSEPEGCPVNPIFITGQTNTYTFSNPVSNFSVDFNAFSTGPGCARLEVKINGLFYHLAAANISALSTSSGMNCSGANVMIVTSDGYLTSDPTSALSTNGQGKITISGVNASSVTFSTNDGAGSIFTNPYNCMSVVPIKLESFSGTSYDCKTVLSWKTETESSVKNMEVEGSEDGLVFKKLFDVIPTGNNSRYRFEINNFSDNYFRLKINDFDGSFQYSEVVKVKLNCYRITYEVKPNPTSNFIEVTGLNPADRITIIDMLGRKVLVFNSPPPGSKFDIYKLAPGMYNIQVINAAMIKANIKMIKN